MADKTILKLSEKMAPPKFLIHFESEDQLRDMPFPELLKIRDNNKLKENTFDEIKGYRRKLRSRIYSSMSRGRKILELKDLEEMREGLLQQQRELENEIQQLRHDISKTNENH